MTDGRGALTLNRVNLAELLVSLAVLGMVLSATFTILDAGQRAHATGSARVETQQNARIALVRLAADLRTAGRSGAAAPVPGVAVAEPDRIVLQSDLDGDGATTGRGETITWRVSGRVLRRDAGGGAQPIVEGVRALGFTYLDAEGRPTAVAAEVAGVEVRLTTQPEHARGALAGGLTTTVATTVGLRNR